MFFVVPSRDIMWGMMNRRRSLADRLTAWWRGKPATATTAPRPVSRERMERCLEDPDGALAMLQEEQGRVAQELEETFLAYDRKLRGMAERLARRSQGVRGAEDGAPSSQELDRMREEQRQLWRLVRRAQAASRSTRGLERELQEWRGHGPVMVPFGHPDHPETRAEIVASELRMRGISHDAPARPEMPAPFAVMKIPMKREAPVVASADIPDAIASRDEADTSAGGPSWVHDTDEHILREIASREREMRKLLLVKQDAETMTELAAFARELRHLHAHLRAHDRRAHVGRVRWTMGIPAGH